MSVRVVTHSVTRVIVQVILCVALVVLLFNTIGFILNAFAFGLILLADIVRELL